MTRLLDLDSLIFAMVNAAERLEKDQPYEKFTGKQVAMLLRLWVQYLSEDSSFDIQQIPVGDIEK